MRQYLLPLLVLPLLLMAACNKNVDPIGGEIRTGHHVHAIVSLSPNVSEILALAGVNATMLVGRTEACNFPPDFVGVDVVMAGVKPDYEKIASMHVDLIVYDASLYSEDDIAKIKALNIDTIEFNATDIESWARFLTEVAKKIGNELHGSGAVDRILGAHSAMQATGSKHAGKSIAVMVGTPDTGYRLAGKESFIGKSLAESGMVLAGGDSNDFAQVNLEHLIQLNPDFIVTTKKQQAAILNDPQLQSLAAVKAKRVLGIEDDILMRVGGRLELLFNGLAAGIDAMSRMN